MGSDRALGHPPAGLHGGVPDWIHVWFYGPTFNLADLWLRGGLLAAAGAWLWHHRRQPGAQPDPATESTSRALTHAPSRRPE